MFSCISSNASFPTWTSSARIAARRCAILAAREPLPLTILQKLFNWQEDELRDFTRTLGSLFPVTVERGTQIIKPYHRSLADWLAVEAKAGPYFASVREGHQSLAAACWAEYQRRRAGAFAVRVVSLAGTSGCGRAMGRRVFLALRSAFHPGWNRGRFGVRVADDIATVFQKLPEGDHRRRLLAMLQTQSRSEKAAMARMAIRSLAAIAEHDPAGVSEVVTTMMVPSRQRGPSTAQANIQAARVAIEVAVQTCHLPSMEAMVRTVILAACATRDSNVRSLAIVAVFRLVHINQALGMSIVQELANRSVRLGLDSAVGV